MGGPLRLPGVPSPGYPDGPCGAADHASLRSAAPQPESEADLTFCAIACGGHNPPFVSASTRLALEPIYAEPGTSASRPRARLVSQLIPIVCQSDPPNGLAPSEKLHPLRIAV
jgi:hypothetical protein